MHAARAIGQDLRLRSCGVQRPHLDAAGDARPGVGDGELAGQSHDAGGALQGNPREQARR
jgi:hypothetical protein